MATIGCWRWREAYMTWSRKTDLPCQRVGGVRSCGGL